MNFNLKLVIVLALINYLFGVCLHKTKHLSIEVLHVVFFVSLMSPRQGELFDMKNRAKARFKGAMRFIRSHEDSLRKDSLAKKLLCKNDKEFWKEIKRMRSKVSLPNVIDGVTGSDSIVNMWRYHIIMIYLIVSRKTIMCMICIITCVMNQT